MIDRLDELEKESTTRRTHHIPFRASLNDALQAVDNELEQRKNASVGRGYAVGFRKLWTAGSFDCHVATCRLSPKKTDLELANGR